MLTATFTKFNWLSIFVANNQTLICLILRFCSIFQPMIHDTALPFPSDGWHACSRRCHLALDLTVRGTGCTYPSLHSLGNCIVVGVFCVFCLWLMLLLSRNRFPLNLRLSLSFRWQKGDRPDNDLRWAMQHPDKKKGSAITWGDAERGDSSAVRDQLRGFVVFWRWQFGSSRSAWECLVQLCVCQVFGWKLLGGSAARREGESLWLSKSLRRFVVVLRKL